MPDTVKTAVRTDPYKLLVFDWDGTLADSLQHIIASIRHSIEQLALPQRDDSAIRSIIGLGLEQALQRLFPGIDDEQRLRMERHYREHYRSSSANNTSLFPEVEQTIRVLHSNGLQLAVATGKSRRGLDRALQESGLGRYFHYTRCADETFSKPHPQMLEELMAIQGVSSGEVLMIGDSEHDLQMAKNAGVASVAVTYGAQERDYLLKFGPLACFNSLQELPPWLARVQPPAL